MITISVRELEVFRILIDEALWSLDNNCLPSKVSEEELTRIRDSL